MGGHNGETLEDMLKESMRQLERDKQKINRGKGHRIGTNSNPSLTSDGNLRVQPTVVKSRKPLPSEVQRPLGHIGSRTQRLLAHVRPKTSDGSRNMPLRISGPELDSDPRLSEDAITIADALRLHEHAAFSPTGSTTAKRSETASNKGVW